MKLSLVVVLYNVLFFHHVCVLKLMKLWMLFLIVFLVSMKKMVETYQIPTKGNVSVDTAANYYYKFNPSTMEALLDADGNILAASAGFVSSLFSIMKEIQPLPPLQP